MSESDLLNCQNKMSKCKMSLLIWRLLDVKMSMYCSRKSVRPWFDVTCTVSTGSSNTGWTRNVNQTERMKLVMKNPPHTAHISHSRLKEWRLVLSGTRALPLWTRRVVVGKYTLTDTSLHFAYIVNKSLCTWKATSLFQCSPASSPSFSWQPNCWHWSTVPLIPGRPGSRPRRWGSSILQYLAMGTLAVGTCGHNQVN